jgi:hypothetical protein
MSQDRNLPRTCNNVWNLGSIEFATVEKLAHLFWYFRWRPAVLADIYHDFSQYFLSKVLYYFCVCTNSPFDYIRRYVTGAIEKVLLNKERICNQSSIFQISYDIKKNGVSGSF